MDELRAEEDGALIAAFGGRLATVQEDACKLCQLFMKAAGGGDRHGLELRAYSTAREASWFNSRRRHKGSKLLLADLPFLSVRSKYTAPSAGQHCDVNGYIYVTRGLPERGKLAVPLRLPPKIDCAVIRHWIDYCSLHHAGLCSESVGRIAAKRLIDCRALAVVLAPKQCKYVALSYVWNQQNPNLPTAINEDGSLDPRQMPEVVIDAIEVVRNMSLNYLWVDRYCINQHDALEKHAQIQRMDAIYRGAYFTIIAAGRSGRGGLAGVSAPRTEQPIASCKDFSILSTMRDIPSVISASKWSKRGWCFQEGVLSKRRVFFTDEQLYFECTVMNCTEVLQGNVDMIYHEGYYSAPGVGSEYSRSPFDGGIFFYQISWASDLFGKRSPWEKALHYFRLIEDYSQTKLTFDEDILNAMAGICASMECSGYPLHHIWGIPLAIQQPVHGPKLFPAWLFIRALCWSNFASRARRPHRDQCPSWSWASWKGPVLMESREHSDVPWHVSHMADVRIGRHESIDGEWKRPYDMTKADIEMQPRFLRIKTKALSSSYLQERFLARWDVSLLVSTAEHHDNKYRSRGARRKRSFEKIRKGEWRALYMGRDASLSLAMLVEQQGLSAVRVGTLWWLNEGLYPSEDPDKSSATLEDVTVVIR